MSSLRPGDRVKFVSAFDGWGPRVLPGTTGTVIQHPHVTRACTAVRLDVGNRVVLPYTHRLKRIADSGLKDIPHPSKKFDTVNQPEHYAASKVEVIDAIEAWGLHKNAYLKDVVKYVARHEKKNGIEDLKKAHMYLTREINRLEGRASWEKGWA